MNKELREGLQQRRRKNVLTEQRVSHLTQMEDILSHRKAVQHVADHLIHFYLNNNEVGLALAIGKRAAEHDASKFEKDEYLGMCSDTRTIAQMGDDDKGVKIDPWKAMGPEKRKAVRLHYQRNRHHPEHFPGNRYETDMTQLDVIEMCIDWYARSIQFNNNPIEFLEIVRNDRYNFSDAFYAKVKSCLELIEVLISTGIGKDHRADFCETEVGEKIFKKFETFKRSCKLRERRPRRHVHR